MVDILKEKHGSLKGITAALFVVGMVALAGCSEGGTGGAVSPASAKAAEANIPPTPTSVVKCPDGQCNPTNICTDEAVVVGKDARLQDEETVIAQYSYTNNGKWYTSFQMIVPCNQVGK